MTDNLETLRPYVADMSAVTKHIQEAVERQINDDDFKKIPQASALVGRLATVLNRQTQSLDSHLQKFPGGGVAGAVKNTVTGVLGAVAGLYDKVRTETVSRGLRDDYTALNLAAISYSMLHTSALGLGEKATAEIALAGLKELTPFIMQLTEVVPQAVLQELKTQGKTADASVLQQVVRETQEAWSAPVPAHAK
jgi:glycerol-3-phosphate dehydrogenase